MDIITKRNVCAKCGRDDVSDHAIEWDNGLCSCCASWKAHYAGRQQDNLSLGIEERSCKWLKMCPPKYMENDISVINGDSYSKVRKWRVNPKGILCLGDSQRGKTTSCWRLLMDLYIQFNVPFMAMTEPEFSQLASKHMRSRNVDEFLEKLCFAKVFFLDDIGHSATTSKHLEELYYVIEQRTAWKRPVIATSQFTTSELTEKARGSGADKTITAIINRLKASCNVVIF